MRITSSLFEAFLKCPTKCFLRSLGETGFGNEYAEWVRAQDESYERQAVRRLQETVPEVECVVAPPSTENFKTAKWRLAVNVVAQTAARSEDSHVRESLPNEETRGLSGPRSGPELESRLHAVERVPSEGRGKPAQFIPIRFIFRNKLTKDDKLLLAFDAFVLGQALGRDIALGKIIHGDPRSCARQSAANIATSPVESRTEKTSSALSQARLQPQVLKVKTAALFGEVRRCIEKISVMLSGQPNARSADSHVRESQSNEETRGLSGPSSLPPPPDPVLNRHCAECEFRDHCRQKAIETDDLSLLAGMSAKERQKLRSKGIFTVTQLSYTFRPRRRPKRLRDKREKYHHALKALAIREKKIHIVGSPELKIEGTPVYLDVEGLPDRDFYYLIGVRIGHGDSAVQHSLWADTVADEVKIWREFLALLETVEKPVLIHYGSYEVSFLKRMCERHGVPPADSAANQATGKPTNLPATFFAQVYYPTHSNGLKAIAHFLGFQWSEVEPSGLKALLWRHHWEATRSVELREKLIAYNEEDCHALEIVLDSLALLTKSTTNDASASTQAPQTVSVEAIKRCENRFGNFTSPIAQFEQINKAARWDYQRNRIYVRSSKLLRRNARRCHVRRPNRANATKRVPYTDRPICPLCGGRGASRASCSRVLHDLFFGKSCIKRWTIDYRFCNYWCSHCHKVFGTPKDFWPQSKYGRQLVAFLLYLSVEVCVFPS